MKKFLLALMLFTLPVCAGILALCFLADGKTDPYYLRFTTARQSSLILGTSRAAQGLQPAVFDSIINRNNGKRFFNYSFSLLDSPFGPAYFESIRNKLDTVKRDGYFIVTVDPWGISVSDGTHGISAPFPESQEFIGITKNVNQHPNFGYLFRSFKEPLVNIFHKWRKPPVMLLHPDGWLEINHVYDSGHAAKSLEEKLLIYRNSYLPRYKLSPQRLGYLNKTIRWLKNYGRVYLVRLPVHPQMLEIENKLMPQFNGIVSNVSSNNKVAYLDLSKTGNRFLFTDGNHLYKTSGAEVSARVANWIIGKETE